MHNKRVYAFLDVKQFKVTLHFHVKSQLTACFRVFKYDCNLAESSKKLSLKASSDCCLIAYLFVRQFTTATVTKKKELTL